MSIQYPRPVGPTDRYVLFRLSTSEVINNNALYPNSTGLEVEGLNPDLIYLHKEEPFARPDYDSRHRSLVVDQTPDLEDGLWATTYTTQLRPLPERELAVENEEQNQFYRHFQIERLAIETALMVGLMYQFAIDGSTIPEKWKAKMDTYRDKVKDKILPNIDAAEQLKALLATAEPDLDAPWTEPTP